MPSSTATPLHSVIGTPSPVVSVAPVRLAAPGRPVPLEVRVSAPATGTDLPVSCSRTATDGTSTAMHR